ncbi:hypothetical protein BpHYR1_051073 [Brachionus plicatilis]|uniref:Uncharacterized protein n=1 Tax=Brachionus plicatilis TaxID=10195 RepID=A0A3M7QVI8_BRAPC|nr:hypothetical protein BpHYR1_051073 [Brachionus plicatilis]
MSLGLWFQASLNSCRVRSQIKSARMSGAVYDERPTCFLGEDAVITMPHAYCRMRIINLNKKCIWIMFRFLI